MERLSKADLFGVDVNDLLAMYANAPKAKPAVGKACITPEEVSLLGFATSVACSIQCNDARISACHVPLMLSRAGAVVTSVAMRDIYAGIAYASVIDMAWLPVQVESMVERLYSTKPNSGITYKARPKPMKAIFYIENGAHLSRLEPIPPKPAQERTEFMVRLTRASTPGSIMTRQNQASRNMACLEWGTARIWTLAAHTCTCTGSSTRPGLNVGPHDNSL